MITQKAPLCDSLLDIFGKWLFGLVYCEHCFAKHTHISLDILTTIYTKAKGPYNKMHVYQLYSIFLQTLDKDDGGADLSNNQVNYAQQAYNHTRFLDIAHKLLITNLHGVLCLLPPFLKRVLRNQKELVQFLERS